MQKINSKGTKDMGEERYTWPELKRSDIRNYVTPREKKIKRGTIIPPEGGWENQTWYAVDVAFSAGNPIHAAVLYSGFFDIGSYVFVVTEDGTPCKIGELFYMKGIRKINVEG